ncbi:MAG: methylated-DNA--[protein]-cysteine S-methyltransferase [Thermoleophilia bacterium]
MEKEATFMTPFGEGTVLVEDGRLAEVRLPTVDAVDGCREAGWSVPHPLTAGTPADGSLGARAERIAGAPRVADSPAERADSATGWARELEAYFRGERLGWTDAEVGLEAYTFTPFRTAVYRALLSVPAGETVTYGELARRAGRPGAARAVGSAMAENPIAVVVPCHRVVRGDGSLGRYGFGAPWKRFLLEAEGALDGTGRVAAAAAPAVAGSPLP